MDFIDARVVTTFNVSMRDEGKPLINSISAGYSDAALASAALSFGTGQRNINQGVFLEGELSSPTTINLWGNLQTPFNEVARFTNIKAAIIVNRADQSGRNLLVGGAASTQFRWTHEAAATKSIVRPLGHIAWASPLDGVTAGQSQNLLLLDPGAFAIPYAAIFLGEFIS